METIIGVLLIIMAIFLIISVLMQSSKNHRLSGSIAGGAETFFGKQKGKTMDALFNKLTTVVTIVFVVLVLVLLFIQPSEEELIAELIEDGVITTETVDPDAAGETDVTAEDGAEAADDEVAGDEVAGDEAVDTQGEPTADADAETQGEAEGTVEGDQATEADAE